MKRISNKRRRLLARIRDERSAFEVKFPDCWRCDRKWRLRFPAELDIHEMVRGSDRHKGIQHRSTWLRLCRLCHEEVATWPIAMQLALKALKNPEFYDRVQVNLLRGRAPDAVSHSEVLEAMDELVRMWGGDAHDARFHPGRDPTSYR